MAVKSNEKEGKLTLEIDNGELKKLKEVMEKWSFKDYQSLQRFMISILFLNEDKSLSIKLDGRQQDIVPASDLLKS